MRTTLKIEVIVLTMLVLLVFGTVMYSTLEGWNYIDSFYFTGVTLTTIGYGDLHPTTDASKIFTVFFAFAGVSVVLFTLTTAGQYYYEKRKEYMDKIAVERASKLKEHRKSVRRKRNEILKGSRN